MAIIVGSIAGTPWVLFTLIPALIGFGAYWVRTITRSLRYSIAPTSSGGARQQAGGVGRSPTRCRVRD
jgi:putative membrane protein